MIGVKDLGSLSRDVHVIFLRPKDHHPPIKVSESHRNEMMYSSQRLDGDLLIISGLCSEPESLHICKHILEDIRIHAPRKYKSVAYSETVFAWKLFSSEVDLIWHLKPRHPV